MCEIYDVICESNVCTVCTDLCSLLVTSVLHETMYNIGPCLAVPGCTIYSSVQLPKIWNNMISHTAQQWERYIIDQTLTHWPLGDMVTIFTVSRHMFMGSSCEIALWWIPQHTFDDKSTLVKVMAWWCQAASHYLSQCWPRCMSPYGVTMPQWVKTINTTLCPKVQAVELHLCIFKRTLTIVKNNKVHFLLGIITAFDMCFSFDFIYLLLLWCSRLYSNSVKSVWVYNVIMCHVFVLSVSSFMCDYKPVMIMWAQQTSSM